MNEEGIEPVILLDRSVGCLRVSYCVMPQYYKIYHAVSKGICDYIRAETGLTAVYVGEEVSASPRIKGMRFYGIPGTYYKTFRNSVDQCIQNATMKAGTHTEWMNYYFRSCLNRQIHNELKATKTDLGEHIVPPMDALYEDIINWAVINKAVIVSRVDKLSEEFTREKRISGYTLELEDFPEPAAYLHTSVYVPESVINRVLRYSRNLNYVKNAAGEEIGSIIVERLNDIVDYLCRPTREEEIRKIRKKKKGTPKIEE